MKKIVIVEDEDFMRDELASTFEKEGYLVSCIVSFDHTASAVIAEVPNLVLLDVNLPQASGFEICKELKKNAGFPVLILTSREQLKDELHALGLGADEYLTKPCRRERLLARAENLLRRYEGREHLLDGNGLLLDRRSYTLYIERKAIILPENQGKILELLISHRAETVTKETLFFALWGTTEYVDENALQVNMTRLKKTLKTVSMEGRIVTIRGEGYQWIG